ncbi:MAG: DUF3078 domain-containing protein [Niabella sp.]
MKRLLLLLGVFAVMAAQAQDETVKKLKDDASRTISKGDDSDTTKAWKKGGFYNLNIAQGSLVNWAAGGDKFSFAINTNLSAYAFYKKGKRSWDNTMDINLGYINTTSLGGRKNDDRIDILSKYGRSIAPKWNISGLVNLRSQLFKGYSYDDDNAKTFNSSFLSPGYLLASPGIEFKPAASFSAFASPITARWTIVLDDSLSSVGAYGVDSSKHIKTELGAFATLNYFKEFNKMISFKSRLDFFPTICTTPKMWMYIL